MKFMEFVCSSNFIAQIVGKRFYTIYAIIKLILGILAVQLMVVCIVAEA